jgi:excisionase family DNA binding protein
VSSRPPCECDDLRHRLARIEAVLWPADRWMRTGEVCRRLSIKPTTLRSAIAAGRVPAQRVRGRWEVDPDWVARQIVDRGAAR